MAVELFTNPVSTIVSSGGTDAPAAGTSQSWTVAGSGGFPAAVANGTAFHIIDPDNPYEIMLVTNISGTTWTVPRGVEGTVVFQYLSAVVLNSFVQAGGLGMVQVADSLAFLP